MSDDSLRKSAITTQSVAFVGVVGLALLARAGLHLSGWYPLKAAGVFAVVIVAAVRHMYGHHPFGCFGAANQITTVRAGLVTLIASLIGEPQTPIAAAVAVGVCVAVTVLDGVDGWVARRTRMVSAFGMRFDMETDAALILVLAILVWQYGKAGPWVLGSGLLRYAFVAAGWLWPWIGRPLGSSFRGRAICVAQVLALMLALVPTIAPPASATVAACGLLALCYSFLVDTVWLWRTRAAPGPHVSPRTQ